MVTNAASRSRSILVLVAAAAVLDVAGAQHVYRQPTIAAAVLSLVALLWLAPAAVWQPRGAGNLPDTLLALLPVAAFVASMVDLATFVPPIADGGGWSALRLWALAGGIGALLVAGRVGVGALALVAAGIGIAIRLVHLDHIALVPANGDMLPLVDGALRNLLAGRSPYMTYKMPWDVPLTYLPTTWLAYLPAYLLGVDLRWTNIAAELAVLGAVAWLGWQRRRAAVWRDEPAIALWAWLFLQPSVIHWDAGNTAPITWALLAATLALAVGRRPRSSAVALGLTAAGTPLVAVFGPFVGLFWLRRYGFWAAARLAIIAGVVAALFVVPFFLWEPIEFRTGVWRWFNNIDGWPRQKWLETDPHIWSIITGFSGEFWSRGTQHWLKPIQAVIVALALGLFWLRGARAQQLCAHAAAAYLGFMLFNPVLWPYLYNPVLIAGLVGVGALLQEEPVAAPAPLRSVDAAHQPSLS